MGNLVHFLSIKLLQPWLFTRSWCVQICWFTKQILCVYLLGCMHYVCPIDHNFMGMHLEGCFNYISSAFPVSTDANVRSQDDTIIDNVEHLLFLVHMFYYKVSWCGCGFIFFGIWRFLKTGLVDFYDAVNPPPYPPTPHPVFLPLTFLHSCKLHLLSIDWSSYPRSFCFSYSSSACLVFNPHGLCHLRWHRKLSCYCVLPGNSAAHTVSTLNTDWCPPL